MKMNSIASRFTKSIFSRLNLARFADFKCLSVRSLYSKEELGVIQFENNRQKAFDELNTTPIEQFKENLLVDFKDLKVHQQRNNLKKFMFLVNNNEVDLNNLKALLLEYYSSYSSNVHFVKEFVFATEIMRLFYILNLPDKAVEFFKDSELRLLFQQMETYKILLDLLFENQRYEEVFKLYGEIRQHLEIYELMTDKTINCLVFGACYKLNTPEHFEYAQNLWKNVQHIRQISRTKHFLAGLAIKQNKPKFALSLYDNSSAYVVTRFIKLSAYTLLGQFDNANNLLKQTIRVYKLKFTSNKPCYGKQMIEDLRQAIEKSGTETQLVEFNKINGELTSMDLLSDETIDDFLFVTFPPMLSKTLYKKMRSKASKSN